MHCLALKRPKDKNIWTDQSMYAAFTVFILYYTHIAYRYTQQMSQQRVWIISKNMISMQSSTPACHNWPRLHHGLWGSNKQLYKRCAFSMGEAKFRPPRLPHFQPIFLKLKTRMHNLVKIGSPGASGREPKFWPYILGYLFYFFVLFAQRPGRTASNGDQWGLKRRVFSKGSTFWGRNNQK